MGGRGNPCRLQGEDTGCAEVGVLLGKPVWDRPRQKAVEPGACAEGEERRGVGAEAGGTCPLVGSTTLSSHLCTEARNPRWGRLCGHWGDCFGTPGWGPRGRPGSKTHPTPGGAKRQPGFRRAKVDKGPLADRAVSEIGSRCLKNHSRP